MCHEVTGDFEFDEEYKKYDRTPIGRALVLAKLEEAAKLRTSTTEEDFKDADCDFLLARQKYEKRIVDATSRWRSSLENPNPELLVSITAENSFVKDVVRQIERAMEIF